MKREFLKNLGLEDEAIDKIMDENGRDIEKAKSGLKELEDKVTLLENQITEKNTKIEEMAKSSDDAESLKNKIKELQDLNETQKKAIEQSKIDSAIELALVNSKAKNTKAVKSLLDLTNAELVDGKIKGLEDQIKKLQESDGYLFNSETKQMKGMTPSGGADETKGSPDDAKNFGSDLAKIALSRLGINKTTNKE